jgi:hypothetical protein
MKIDATRSMFGNHGIKVEGCNVFSLAIATPDIPFGKPDYQRFQWFYIWKTLFHHFYKYLCELLSTTMFLLQCVSNALAHKTDSSKK